VSRAIAKAPHVQVETDCAEWEAFNPSGYARVTAGRRADLQASFAKTLKKILEEFCDNWNRIAEEPEKLRQRIISASQEPTYGLHRKKQMPMAR